MGVDGCRNKRGVSVSGQVSWLNLKTTSLVERRVEGLHRYGWVEERFGLS